MKSTVKWFNNIKGYGFIRINEKEDAIVHYSSIDNHNGNYKFLLENDEVEFDLVKTKNGWRAENVHKAFKKEE